MQYRWEETHLPPGLLQVKLFDVKNRFLGLLVRTNNKSSPEGHLWIDYYFPPGKTERVIVAPGGGPAGYHWQSLEEAKRALIDHANRFRPVRETLDKETQA